MIPTQKPRTYRAERDFGVIVGGVFVALGGWWLFRGKFQAAAPGLLFIGSVLVFFAAVKPKALVHPNRMWMALARLLSFVATRVILTFVFFAVVTPIGVMRRLFGGDPLGRRSARLPSYWGEYLGRRNDSRHYEKMY